MKKIRNVSPYGALDVPLLGVIVDAGEVVKVEESAAEILLEQAENFVPADGPEDSDEPDEPAEDEN